MAILLANLIILPAKACPPELRVDYYPNGGLTTWEVPGSFIGMYHIAGGIGMLQVWETDKKSTWYLDCAKNDCGPALKDIDDGNVPSRPPGATDTRPDGVKPIMPRSISKPQKPTSCSKWKSTISKAKNDAKKGIEKINLKNNESY